MSRNFLPDRIYDIKLDRIIHRREASSITIAHGYITISHRWNNTESAIETFDGMDQKCQLSNIEKLRAAIPVAKENLINYIWMDSMCVDQDTMKTDVYDMYDIYKYSKITLVMIKIDKAHEQQIINKDIAREYKFIAFKRIMDHDWWNRIWTLQEMLLSQDKLYFVNIKTQNMICTFEEYRSLYNYYKTQDNYRKQLNEHEINTCVYNNRTLSAREVMAMCQNRCSTMEEDYAWGIAGILNLTMSFRYGIGKQRALRRLAKYLTKKGDITFLDYWGPCSDVSYLPMGYEEYKPTTSLNDRCQPQSITISEAGLNIQVYSPTELTEIKPLKKYIDNNVAKRFVALGGNNSNLYERIVCAINPNCNLESRNVVSKLARSHYQRIKYSNADIICDVLKENRLLEGCKEIFHPSIENETLFLAYINSKISTIGYICTSDPNLIVKNKKLQLFMAKIPQISFPFVVTHIKDNTYRIIGRIKNKIEILDKRIINITIQ